MVVTVNVSPRLWIAGIRRARISAIYVHWYLTLHVSSSKDYYTLSQARDFVQRVLAALSGQRDPDLFPGLHAAAYFSIGFG